MSDVTMLRRLYVADFGTLCVADFGHAMSALHCRWPKKFGRFQPEPSQNQGCFKPADLILFSKPVLLLWSLHQPYLTFRRSRIDSRRDRCVGMVKFQQEEGELSCFLAFACSNVHNHLTNQLQTDVCAQANGHKLLQPHHNTQNHQPTCCFHRSIT
jgi:hypothetical protein